MTMGVGKGLTNSGAAEWLANLVAGIVGGNASPFIVLIVVGILFTIMGNFMSHTSILTLMLPVFIPVAAALNLDVTVFVYAITMFVNAACSLPLGKASYTMTMAEGYSMMDYFKATWMINAFGFVLTTVVCGIWLAAV